MSTCVFRARETMVRVGAMASITLAIVALAHAQDTEPSGALSSVPLPGTLAAAHAAIADYVTPDRSQFLLELIRRSHRTPIGASDPHDPLIESLVSHLDQARLKAKGSPIEETLPLPLPAPLWIDAVFGGHATPQTLARDIIRSRGAALLYYGLLSLDDPTRVWLGGQRDLVADLAARYPAPFVLAAPGVRIASRRVQVPGGSSAEPAWEALVGKSVSQPADFLRALLSAREGRLAWFYGAMAQLTPPQHRTALDLDGDAAARVSAARRLHAVFEHIGLGWTVEARSFWRPVLDPALLLGELPADAAGRPQLPGTRSFWIAVFDEDRRRTNGSLPNDSDAVPLDFAWLCEQIFRGDPIDHRLRYQQVLLASRLIPRLKAASETDAIDAIRATASFPALVTMLERHKVTDVAVYARAARRAAQLSALDDDARMLRAVTQFQGLLALVARAASRGALPGSSFAATVSSLSSVEPGPNGDYEGRLTRWIDEHLRTPAAPSARAHATPSDDDVLGAVAGPVERDLMRLLAGPPEREPRFVEWEGTRYRIDLARAEAIRLTRLIGEEPRPYLSSAHTLVVMADGLAASSSTSDRLREHASAFERLARVVGWVDGDDWPADAIGRYRTVADALLRPKRADTAAAGSRVAPALRELADDLLARGLLELTYAAALGQPDRAWVSASDAARRHDFGLRNGGVRRRAAPWRLPAAGGDTLRGWRVVGSLFGLDVRLAEFALMRLSARPPVRRPSLNEDHRRVFVEAVTLVEPSRLADDDRDVIVAAMRRGRARLAAMHTPDEALALADEIGLSPARRSLLPWMLVHDRARISSFLSPAELFGLGLEGAIDVRFAAWGVPAESRAGCLCLQLVTRRPWETFAGRWGTGILASSFPDLNLRLAELLADLQMPASLLGPVLASATLDLVNTAVSRDHDDRRGLVEFVQSLSQERLEQYLALLTTDGALVPVGEAPESTARTGEPR